MNNELKDGTKYLVHIKFSGTDIIDVREYSSKLNRFINKYGNPVQSVVGWLELPNSWELANLCNIIHTKEIPHERYLVRRTDHLTVRNMSWVTYFGSADIDFYLSEKFLINNAIWNEFKEE